jgi:hypothetical protein
VDAVAIHRSPHEPSPEAKAIRPKWPSDFFSLFELVVVAGLLATVRLGALGWEALRSVFIAGAIL